MRRLCTGGLLTALPTDVISDTLCRWSLADPPLAAEAEAVAVAWLRPPTCPCDPSRSSGSRSPGRRKVGPSVLEPLCGFGRLFQRIALQRG